MRAGNLRAAMVPLVASVLSAGPAASQTPQSALVNQRSEETLEAARAAEYQTELEDYELEE